MQRGILGLFLVLNIAALFCALNPWLTGWQSHGIVVIVVEGAAILFVGLPVWFYHFVWKRESFKQSLESTLGTVMEWISHFAP